MSRETQHIDPAQSAEIDRLEVLIAGLERGEVDPAYFQRFRLKNGIYGIRGSSDHHMVRIKLPFGRANAEQLEAIADVAERYTPKGIAHVTTRQAIQLHHVPRRALPELLRRLASVGLTTREACGNSVRNVTACPYAGISPTETFDVTPYAKTTYRFFLRNPIAQNLPRKFKIAFEGCSEDHARLAIHDVGALAVLDQEGRRGFRLLVGGGLGPAPMAAILLEPFTPAELLLPTLEAIVRVFDRHGERKIRSQARLKFLIRKWGEAAFREAVLAERETVLATQPGRAELGEIEEEAPPEDVVAGGVMGLSLLPGFEAWKRTNVRPQKQSGWVSVTVRLPLGDITAAQLRALARIARRHTGGRLGSTIGQNLMLRWVPEAALSKVYAELYAAGLAHAGAETLSDITRCPGADTCNIAITHSRALADRLEALLEKRYPNDRRVGEISIKISGCPNSCGHHHIADIGLYGAARKVNGHEVPHYVILLGGRTGRESASFGKVVASIPARRIPQAIQIIIDRYLGERGEDESFADYVSRVGPASFKPILRPLAQVPPYETAPELYEDLGAEGEKFEVQSGPGECAV